jgi:predicted secreted protein
MSDIAIGENDNGRQIEMHPQQTMRVSLTEVRTAGYRWNLRASDQRTLLLLADGLDPATGKAGGVGTHHWEFLAEQAGETEIAFEYGRSWERAAETTRSFSLTVRVS